MQQKVSVKFKIGTKLYSFLAEDLELKKGDNVVVETIIGQAYGQVEKIEEYNPAKENRELKKVLRKATKEDDLQYQKMNEKEHIALQETKDLATKLNLEMTVVNAEYSLDGSKVVIDFIAEDRVDFRDLVKELATKLKSRIELRQIGIRDQAKMVGGIGICGRVCCCSSYLKDFEKVSIKMAKCQGLALNPTKISGSCGRLMCCLAYEDNYYSEVYPKIPKLNKEIKTPDGMGVVVYTNALKQIVSVKLTANDGSFVIKDYTLDALSAKPTQQESSLKDYKNFNANLEKNNQASQNINIDLKIDSENELQDYKQYIARDNIDPQQNLGKMSFEGVNNKNTEKQNGKGNLDKKYHKNKFQNKTKNLNSQNKSFENKQIKKSSEEDKANSSINKNENIKDKHKNFKNKKHYYHKPNKNKNENM